MILKRVAMFFFLYTYAPNSHLYCSGAEGNDYYYPTDCWIHYTRCNVFHPNLMRGFTVRAYYLTPLLFFFGVLNVVDHACDLTR